MPQRHRSIVSELANLLRAAAQAHTQVGGAQAGGGGGSVRWGGQQFENAPALVAWINAHGGHQTVPGFLSTHPGAASIFAGGGQPPGAAAGSPLGVPSNAGFAAPQPGFSMPGMPGAQGFAPSHLLALLGRQRRQRRTARPLGY